MAPNNYIVNGKRVSADEYNKSKYEDIRVRVPKGRKAEIQAHAEEQGESVNKFINRAIEEAFHNDKNKPRIIVVEKRPVEPQEPQTITVTVEKPEPEPKSSIVHVLVNRKEE